MDVANTIEPLKNKFDALEYRERIIVIAGLVFLVISLFYLAVWDPIISARDAERQHYSSQQQTLSWMQEAVREIQSLKSTGASTVSRFKNQSVSALAERSAQSTGIKPYIIKQESDKQGVKIQLEQADFDRLIMWLNDMEQKYAIQAGSVHIEKQAASGAVNARVTLERNQE
jgi:general secretion pathway protein M